MEHKHKPSTRHIVTYDRYITHFFSRLFKPAPILQISTDWARRDRAWPPCWQASKGIHGKGSAAFYWAAEPLLSVFCVGIARPDLGSDHSCWAGCQQVRIVEVYSRESSGRLQVEYIIVIVTVVIIVDDCLWHQSEILVGICQGLIADLG